jgi:hypothetical protein
VIYVVDGWLRDIFKIRYYLLNLLPPSFLAAIASIL